MGEHHIKQGRPFGNAWSRRRTSPPLSDPSHEESGVVRRGEKRRANNEARKFAKKTRRDRIRG